MTRSQRMSVLGQIRFVGSVVWGHPDALLFLNRQRMVYDRNRWTARLTEQGERALGLVDENGHALGGEDAQ